MPTKARLMTLLDEKAATERFHLTSVEVVEQLGISPQSASNVLSRFVRDGLLDRVSRGHYAIRQIGTFGTKAASQDISLAVGAAFSGELHRISHRSALAHHGLLVHPARLIQVSLVRRVEFRQVSGRSLKPIIESSRTVEIASEPAGNDAFVSTVNRAILECANRPALAGGWNVIAHALYADRLDRQGLESLAGELGMIPALRRIASIADAIGFTQGEWGIQMPKTGTRPIHLDPTDTETTRMWLDSKWRVVWPEPPCGLVESLAA